MRSTSAILRRAAASSSVRAALSLFFVLNTVFLLCFAQSFAYLSRNGFYADGGEALRESILDDRMKESSHNALLYFHYHLLNISSDESESAYLTEFAEAFSEGNSNFYFVFRENGRDIFSNYTNEQPGRSYCPDSEAFFKSDENVTLICGTSQLTFEGYLKKTLTAKDAYMKISRFFRYADALKYAVIGLLVVSVLLEIWLCVLLFRSAGVRADSSELFRGELDRIPLYLLLLFYLPVFAVGIHLLQTETEKLYNWVQYLSGTDISPALYPSLYSFFLLAVVLAALLKTLVTTLSVRFKMPLWWQQSVLFRAANARGIGQRLRIVLSVLTAAEFAALIWVGLFLEVNAYVYLLVELVFTTILILFINMIERNVSVWLDGTRRIAAEKRGYMPTDALSGQFRSHAENINFLSRSASAETEKRFINESFSTQLINNVSGSLRGPLSAVAENVAMLEQGALSPAAERRCIEQINSLSQTLKKTIEDLIRISKATTGNLEAQPVQTDVGMMLAQTAGEYAELFTGKGIELVTARPQEPITIQADGQFMWYIFDGILTVLRHVAVPGTRIFLQAGQAKERAVILFRGTVRSTALEAGELIAGNSLGLPTAKVFTELQGGTMRIKCRQDALTVVLQFPQK